MNDKNDIEMPSTLLTESPVESRLVHEGVFFNLYSDTVRLPDGETARREYLRHPGAATILPMFEDGRFLMVRQYRYALERVFIEFPAGKRDGSELPLETAKRELLEETGFTADEFKPVCVIHNAIGYADEALYLYLATGLTAGKQQPDHGEFIEPLTATLPEMLAWVTEGKITDVKTIIGIFWLEKMLKEGWKGQVF